jgi:hypothetical protein
MTEQILSAGVYASENDQSFYSQGISTTGLAVIGPTEKGEAFVPVDVTSYSEFTALFGNNSKSNYTAQTVYNYLQAGSSVKVTRVLGNGGWQYNSSKQLAAILGPVTAGSSGSFASASYATSSFTTNAYITFRAIGNNGTVVTFDGGAGYSVYSAWETPTYKYFETSGSVAANVASLLSAISRAADDLQITGSYPGSGSYFSLTATSVGVGGNSYKFGPYYNVFEFPDSVGTVTFGGGAAPVASGSANIVAVLYPTCNDNPNVALNGLKPTGSFQTFNVFLPGVYDKAGFTASLDPTSDLFLTKVLGKDASTETGSVFPYLVFGNSLTASGNYSTSITSSMVFTSTACTFTSSNSSGYDHAKTPWVLSDGGIRLFKFHHRSDGFKSNKDIKVSIANIRKGSDSNTYSTFDVQVRAWNDIDSAPSILEQYIGVTLNPNSANYIGKMIGDMYSIYDETQSKVITYGDFANISRYIRVEVASGVSSGTNQTQIVPNGYEAIYEPIAGFGTNRLPAAVVINSTSASLTYSGFDYSSVDNHNYLNPVPSEAVTGSNTSFTVPTNDNKFVLPFQGGTDGMNYTIIKKVGAEIAADGTNVFGFDLSSNGAPGYAAYKKALDMLSNNEEYRFDLMVLPGVIEQYHGAVTAYAQSTAEERADCVYLRDLTGLNAPIATAVNTAAGLDSNYSAVYYPWVKVRDLGSSKDILVPPSVVVPEAYAYNDSVAAEWFAPAGLQRGVLGAIDTRVRLSKADRDALYQARINPIAKFPNTGVVIWGQKTLQIRDTALNRINVRRLLIALRNYISEVSKNFVFENNTVQTRNKLVNQIVPYMESVQTRQGLYAFRVQIDETLNTNEVIDRNQLIGKIYVSPAKSIEFILLEFNITATGATFQ